MTEPRTRELGDADARAAALDLERHVLLLAPAGSGKTGVLIQRALKALSVCDQPEQCVAITFTHKAAAEIRSRLVRALQRARDGASPGDAHEQRTLDLAARVLAVSDARGWALIENPARLRAETIDGFNTRLVAQLPLLSGLGGPLAIADVPETLYRDALLNLSATLEQRDADPVLADALATVLRLADNRLDRLQEPLAALLQRREQWLKPILGEARGTRAGSDEQALARIIEDRQQALARTLDSEHCVALAAVARDASTDEKLAWARDLDGWPPTVADAVDRWRPLAGLILTSSGQLRRKVDKRNGFPAGSAATKRMNALLAELGETATDRLSEAARAVHALPDAHYPEDAAHQRAALAQVLLALAAQLKLSFAEHGAGDFVEVATAAVSACQADEDQVLARLDGQVRHLLVDEMQDTSRSQMDLLTALTAEWQPGDGHSLFLVGDPQQSIYLFRQAEVGLFMDRVRSRRLGALPLTVLQLDTNFRSAPGLIRWYNESFARVFPDHADAASGLVAYTPARPPPDAPAAQADAVRVEPVDDPAAEAAAAADEIAALLAAQPRPKIGVLARSRTQLRPLVQELKARGLPFCGQDLAPLQAVPAVADYLALFRALSHPQDRLAWAQVLRAPWLGLRWEALLALSRGCRRESWPRRLARAGQRLDASDAARVSRLLELLDEAAQRAPGDLPAQTTLIWHGLDGPALVDSAMAADIGRLRALLRRHAPAGQIRDWPGFERALAQLYSQPPTAAVELMTIHRSKGLEFDHVLLMGCGRASSRGDKPLLAFQRIGDGLMLATRPPAGREADDPHQRLYALLRELARNAENNEALRLLYVACTRARRSLTLYVQARIEADSGDWRPDTGSLADLIWPVLAPHFDGREPGPAAAEQEKQWCNPPLWRAAHHDRREPPPLPPAPQVPALTTPSDSSDEGGHLQAQLLGTLYHEAMEQLAQAGADSWNDDQRRPALIAGLRRRGLPEPDVEPVCERVMDLVRRTLAGEHGRWLLQRHRWARSEYRLAGWLNDNWIHAAVDRCFEDEQGLWVIDYKTRLQPVAADEAAGYAESLVARHRAQLLAYRRLVAKLRAWSGTVQARLYVPDLDLLVPVDAEGQDSE